MLLKSIDFETVSTTKVT